MSCPHCSTAVPENALGCPTCWKQLAPVPALVGAQSAASDGTPAARTGPSGAVPGALGPGPALIPAQVGPERWASPVLRVERPGLTLAAAAAALTFPLGLVAVVVALQARRRYDRGDVLEGASLARRGRTLSKALIALAGTVLLAGAVALAAQHVPSGEGRSSAELEELAQTLEQDAATIALGDESPTNEEHVLQAHQELGADDVQVGYGPVAGQLNIVSGGEVVCLTLPGRVGMAGTVEQGSC